MHVERIVRNAAAFNAFRPSLDAFFKMCCYLSCWEANPVTRKTRLLTLAVVMEVATLEPSTASRWENSTSFWVSCDSPRGMLVLWVYHHVHQYHPIYQILYQPTQCPLAQEVVRIHSAVCLSDTRPTQKRDTNEIVPAEGYSNQQLHGVVFLILWVCLCTRLKCKRPLNKHFTSSFGVCLLKYLGHISLSHLLCWPFD